MKRKGRNVRRGNEKSGATKVWTFLTGTKRQPVDLVVLLLVLVLFAIGFAMVCSVESVKRGGGSGMLQQFLFGIGGIVLMLFVGYADYRVFNNYVAPVFFVVSIGLNAVNAVRAHGSGGIDRGSGFQASEILKFALVIILAYFFCACEPIFDARKNGKLMRNGKRLRSRAKMFHRQFWFEKRILSNVRSTVSVNVIVMVTTLFSCFVVLCQSHLSGAIIVLLIGFVIMLAGGADKRMLAIFAVLGLILAVLVCLFPEIILKIGLKNYQYERVALWRDKFSITQAKNEEFSSNRSQIEASLKAIGSGGWFGVGYNKSIQKQSFLAASDTDFIFAVVVEELGYIGALVILALFGLLVYRCIKIATSVNDKFGSLIVLGVAAQIGLEVLMNIAVITDSMPNTGITLPFFSKGGTALIMLLVEMGFVLSISKYSSHTRILNKRLSEEIGKFEGDADEFEQSEEDMIE